jgi:8-oxo-dGTP pyrophosphatase MutT (NUDIX family)
MHQTFTIAVKALIQQGDTFLVLKQADSNQDNPLSGWETPGGRLDVGESLEEGLAREILEETGLTVTGAQLYNAFMSDSKSDSPVVGLNYVATTKNGDVTPDPEEHSAYQWLTIPEMRKLTDSIGLQKELNGFEKFIK